MVAISWSQVSEECVLVLYGKWCRCTSTHLSGTACVPASVASVSCRLVAIALQLHRPITATTHFGVLLITPSGFPVQPGVMFVIR